MDTNIEEIWINIPGYEGLYQASNLGRIRSKRGVLKTMIMRRNGYCKVFLCNHGATKCFRAHRIIALSFIDNPNCKPYVNHKNGLKTDNRVENLEWCTARENTLHAVSVNLHPKQYGEFNPMSKITTEIANEIRISNLSSKILSDRFGIALQTVNRIKKGTRWGHLSLTFKHLD